jgi:hypothetical protein
MSEVIQQHRICGIGRTFGPWEGVWRDEPDPNPQYLMDIATRNERVWVERRTVTYGDITKSKDV